jgi:16S rRNA (adenine1518-N6/adenine1519-N6)-dimethyltransferase
MPRAPVTRPRRRFGQHFLEAPWIDKVIDAIGPAADEVFFEIGPGRGALTMPLARRAKRVLACEIDRDLAAALVQDSPPNVRVLQGDFLDLDAGRVEAELLRSEIPAGAPVPVRVAGNLPYNVASPILFRLIALHGAGIPFVDATVMLQREVADRLAASPGTRDFGVLSIFAGRAATIERLLTLPPGAFRPMPKVHSAVVRLRFHPPAPPVESESVFAAMVRAIFSRRRKTLANALAALSLSRVCPPALALSDAGLDGRRRPETLSIPELASLADALARRTS